MAYGRRHNYSTVKKDAREKSMKIMLSSALIVSALVMSNTSLATGMALGAAPKGDAGTVANKIIKYNFPKCKHVSNAIRVADGSIRAKCDGSDYLVFTLFNASEGKLTELAMNCTAAKSLLNVSC